MSDLEIFNDIVGNYGTYSIPLAVLIASLMGSMHCVSMCSPIAIIVKNRKGNLFLYHTGRLLSYIVLGILAGFLGDSFLNNGYHYITVFSVIALSFFLIYSGYRILGKKNFHWELPSWITSILYIPMKWAFKRNRYVMSMVVGIVNGFIPCGWVYLFVIGAVAIADPYYGALLISFFWLGTVPALTVFSVFSDKLIGSFPGKAYKIAGVVLILTGIFNIGYHFIPGTHGHRMTHHNQTIQNDDTDHMHAF